MVRRERGSSVDYHYLHGDHLGCITAVTDEASCQVVERYSYDAWGKQQISPPRRVRFIQYYTEDDRDRRSAAEIMGSSFGISDYISNVYQSGAGGSNEPRERGPDDPRNEEGDDESESLPKIFSDEQFRDRLASALHRALAAVRAGGYHKNRVLGLIVRKDGYSIEPSIPNGLIPKGYENKGGAVY